MYLVYLEEEGRIESRKFFIFYDLIDIGLNTAGVFHLKQEKSMACD